MALGLPGCLETEPPGEQLGVFDVTSTLEENTCGPTAVITGEGQFAIEVRRDQETAYWQYLGGQPLVGRFDSDETFSVELRTFVQLYGPGELEQEQALNDPLDFARVGFPDQADEGPGCTLLQEETLDATVAGDWLAELGDAGVDASSDAGTGESGDAGGAGSDGGASASEAVPPDLTAEHVQTLTPTADSDCRLALGGSGGPFTALPCEIRYSLRATRRP